MYKTGSRGKNDGLTNFWANVCVDFKQATDRGYTPDSCKRCIDKYEGKRKVQIRAKKDVFTGKTQDDWEMALDDWCNFKTQYEDAENAKEMTAEEVNEAARRSKVAQNNMMKRLSKKRNLDDYTDSEDEHKNQLNSASDSDRMTVSSGWIKWKHCFRARLRI
ncbi:MAG: hypothetical protein FRX48_07647 [Lasallia pustulata]|uniref:Uncharacterized protein n=1 Tax=Lasallia pustulata TaxID=136370 RepID=A0A5M8PGW6_9LECA|nr:MAG: hypothetical protein FRX48_07647 [Lasallia pustulata]